METERKRNDAAEMRIEKSQPYQLEEILKVYARARTFMAEHGNPTQWGTTHPPAERVRRDIEEGLSFVCMAGDEIAAVFYFRIGEEPSYRAIYEGEWLNDRPYGVVHRIASAGTVKGAGTFCLQWACEQCGNLRIDTHRNNIVMQNLLKKNGFSYCGIIYLEDGDERLAYQKTLDGKPRERI